MTRRIHTGIRPQAPEHARASVCCTPMTQIQQQGDSAMPHDTPAIRVVPSDQWDALVARLGGDDVYERRGYHVASTYLEPASSMPVLLHFTGTEGAGEAALPLLLRPLPEGGGYDATSAYGYGGPIGSEAVDVAALGLALDEWARANGIVATFLRMHPLLDNARLVPPTAQLVELGATVAWDVRAGRERAWVVADGPLPQGLAGVALAARIDLGD